MTILKNCVKELRENEGMSLRHLSYRSGVPKSTISDIEAGREPGVIAAILLAKALKTSVEHLFCYD